MLKISQYGVELSRLQMEDIELVRFWRNQDFVVKNMNYQKYISPKEQENWFNSIDNKFNYYFIIKFDGKKIGVINSKNYDPKLGFGEGGIFIGEKDYLNTTVPTFATLCLLNAVFFEIKLTTISRIKVLNSNYASIDYNKLLGYKYLEGTNDGISSYFELTLENYTKFGSKLNHAAKIANKNDDTLLISGETSEKHLPEINHFLKNQIHL